MSEKKVLSSLEIDATKERDDKERIEKSIPKELVGYLDLGQIPDAWKAEEVKDAVSIATLGQNDRFIGDMRRSTGKSKVEIEKDVRVLRRDMVNNFSRAFDEGRLNLELPSQTKNIASEIHKIEGDVYSGAIEKAHDEYRESADELVNDKEEKRKELIRLSDEIIALSRTVNTFGERSGGKPKDPGWLAKMFGTKEYEKYTQALDIYEREKERRAKAEKKLEKLKTEKVRLETSVTEMEEMITAFRMTRDKKLRDIRKEARSRAEERLGVSETESEKQELEFKKLVGYIYSCIVMTFGKHMLEFVNESAGNEANDAVDSDPIVNRAKDELKKNAKFSVDFQDKLKFVKEYFGGSLEG